MKTAPKYEHGVNDLEEGKLTLPSGEGTDHDQPRAHAGEETGNTELTGHRDETGCRSLSWEAFGLVDL